MFRFSKHGRDKLDCNTADTQKATRNTATLQLPAVGNPGSSNLQRACQARPPWLLTSSACLSNNEWHCVQHQRNGQSFIIKLTGQRNRNQHADERCEETCDRETIASHVGQQPIPTLRDVLNVRQAMKSQHFPATENAALLQRETHANNQSNATHKCLHSTSTHTKHNGMSWANHGMEPPVKVPKNGQPFVFRARAMLWLRSHECSPERVANIPMS